MVRLPSSCLRRGALTYIAGIPSRHHVLPNQARLPQWLRIQQQQQQQQQRYLHSEGDGETQTPPSTSPTSAPTEPEEDTAQTPAPDHRWDAFKESFKFRGATVPSKYKAEQDVVVHGFLGKRRDKGSLLSFCDLESSSHAFQIVSTWKDEGSLQHTAHQSLRGIPAYSPVCVVGTLVESDQPVSRVDRPNPVSSKSWDIRLRSIQCLNPFPKDIIVSKDAVWSPAQRHLQLRFDPLLRQRLHLRGVIASQMDLYLRQRGFQEVETPLLFKSTPEGAREFLVPTRRQGYAYALPQSPQQYKQILMASGLGNYYQFAKCFRDEDHRADRQPEFTQLDLEMSFATGSNVRHLVEALVRRIFNHLHENYVPTEVKGIWHPTHIGTDKIPVTEPKEVEDSEGDGSQDPTTPKDENGGDASQTPPRPFPKLGFFPTMSYDYAMEHFGSDKPDLRITPAYASNITRIDSILPPEFTSMITHLANPIVEAVKFRFDDAVRPRETAAFIGEFADAIPSTPALKLTSPGSTPGIFVFDSGKPLSGLSALGHEAAQHLASLETRDWKPCRDGDVVVVHAREDTGPRDHFRGSGSTDLGRLRAAIHESALRKGLISPPRPLFRPVWIRDFPLFTPNDNSSSSTTNGKGGVGGEDPGQGGAAGFSSTHHPFTAPLGPEDVDLLRTDPLQARADHYDLVINGVEVGGGSRRIHVAEVQEYVLRDVLRMDDAGVARFAHLLGALRAGCPPHAGFALGFDRFLTVLCDVPSVRDVIAFPKNNKGEDALVGSPSRTSGEQQRVYHLFRTE